MSEITLQCPQCLAPITNATKTCDYCGSKIFVDSIAYLSNLDATKIQLYLKTYKEKINQDSNNIEALIGIGLCYLILKMYSLAQSSFEKVINLHPDLAKVYYYYSLSLIAERRIKSIPSKEMKIIEAYLSTAYNIDPDFKLNLLLLRIIQVDYYMANGLMLKGIFQNDFSKLIDYNEIDSLEIDRLKSAVKVQNFQLFKI